MSLLEKELELNGLEAPDEMPINTVTQQAPQQNSGKPKPACHHCKKQNHHQNQCHQLKREKDQFRNNTNSANNNNGSVQTNSNPNKKVPNNTKANNTNIQRDRRSRPVFPPCETCGRTNHSTEKCYLGANAENRPTPRNRRPEGQNQVQQRNAQSNSDGNIQAAAQTLNKPRHVFTPELHLTDRRQIKHQNFHIVWQQPTEKITNQDNLNNTNTESIIHYTQEKTTVASQTSSPKGTQPQSHVAATEQPSGNQTGKEPVSFLNCSKNSSTDIQNTKHHVVTTLIEKEQHHFSPLQPQ